MRFLIFIVMIFNLLFVPHSVSAKEDGIGLYIQLLPWEEVDKLLPRYSKFTVMDVETGKRFQVQRRAGSGHADVQPLTTEDTKIMKEIYDNEWSWRRKAIIIIHEDQWIAASMHGMPHGAGALKNNFPGHFCIHFYNSTTHRTKLVDLSHQLMIMKAAGELERYLSSQDPIELTYSFIAGWKQRDPKILSITSLQHMDWNRHLASIQNIKLNYLPRIREQTDLAVKLFIDVEWIDDQSNKERFRGEIYLYRFSPMDSWRIDSKRFLQDFGIKDKSK